MQQYADFSNYIYVVILIGSVIVSIINSVFKKKNEAQNQKPKTSPSTQSLEDIFREITQNAPQPLTQPEPKPVFVPKQVAEQPTLAQRQIVMNDAFATKKHNFVQHQIYSEQTAQPIDIQLNSADDWQRAFVHSEIFNRKY
jgi:hypothetical protein